MLTNPRLRALSLLTLSGALAASIALPAHAVPARTAETPTAATTVPVDTVTTFDGIAPKGPRKVNLQRKYATGWKKIDSTTSDATGAFSLDVPTWWYGQHQVRAVAPKVSKKVPAWTSATETFDVTPAHPAVGESTDYKPWGKNSRWDPCTPITWAYNARGMAPEYRTLVEQAFSEMSRATGLRFTDVADTEKVPFTYDIKDRAKEPADIIIAWGDQSDVENLAGRVAGWGGITYGFLQPDAADGSRQVEWTNGAVMLDKDEAWLPATDDGPGPVWGQIIRHEIGHAIGLDHVMVASQIMYPVLDVDNVWFGAGDLGGLRTLGAHRGCYQKSYRAPSARRDYARPIVPQPVVVPEAKP